MSNLAQVCLMVNGVQIPGSVTATSQNGGQVTLTWTGVGSLKKNDEIKVLLSNIDYPDDVDTVFNACSISFHELREN